MKLMFIDCGKVVCCCSSGLRCLIGVVFISLILIMVCGLFIEIVLKCMVFFCSGSRYFLWVCVKLINGIWLGLKCGMFIVMVYLCLFRCFIVWVVIGLLIVKVLLLVVLLWIS